MKKKSQISTHEETKVFFPSVNLVRKRCHELLSCKQENQLIDVGIFEAEIFLSHL